MGNLSTQAGSAQWVIKEKQKKRVKELREWEEKFYVRTEDCSECGGSGKALFFTCKACGGKRRVPLYMCPKCEGDGKGFFFTCGLCSGEGLVNWADLKRHFSVI